MKTLRTRNQLVLGLCHPAISRGQQTASFFWNAYEALNIFNLALSWIENSGFFFWKQQFWILSEFLEHLVVKEGHLSI